MVANYSRFKGYEVTGEAVEGFVVQGFQAFRVLATKYLRAEGIGELDSDLMVTIAPDSWYPMDSFLRAFEQIANEAGDALVFQLGFASMQKARIPFEVVRFDEALVSTIDIAYHLNHRRNGVRLFDPKSGSMSEGIGHFRGEKTPSGTKVVVDTPYPCEFERGMFMGMIAKAGQKALVVHDNSMPCRRRGQDHCEYLVR